VLVTTLIGVPAVTSLTIGAVQLSSVPIARQLTLWGLAGAAAFNLAAAVWLLRGAKERKLCRNWTLIHLLFFIVEYLYFAGHIHFDWLKELLLGLQRVMRG
jgi:hypothetical protein